MTHPTNTQFAVAVHVLTLLGGAPEQVLSSELLAGSAGANPVHVRRVLGALRRAGLVASRPGLHGAAPSCSVGQRIRRALNEVDRRAVRAVEDELARTTIAALAGDTRARDFEPAPAHVRS